MKMYSLFISLIFLLIMAVGCSSQSSSDEGSGIDTKEFIADTSALIKVAEDVYRTGREYTTEEEVDIEFYEEQYGNNEDTDIKLTVNSALLVAQGAKKLDGLEDTFAKDLEYVRQLIEDIK